MIGSSVVAAFPTAGGIYSNKYFLAGKDEHLVTPGEGTLQLGADGILAEYSNGFLTMLFTLTLSKEQYAKADVIFARGPPGDETTGRIPQHSNYYKSTIDWAEGGPPEEEDDTFTQAHGFLMVLVWAVLFPAGIIAARFFRHLDPRWWNLHRGFQGVGVFFFVIAWLLGWKAEGKQEQGMLAHLAFAFLLPIMVIMQVLAAVFRPKKDAENRPKWNLYHHWVGRSAVVLAIVNIYVGLYIYEAESSAVAAFTFVWILVLIVFVGLEWYWRVRGPWSVGYSSPTEIDMQSLNGKQREGFLKL
ncbi:hypothetical protein KFL_001620050 [Klebsormidium nitens]|uniref:Cytochrome b561 domain-containing protein n=1 Tax=Klebsormidium nitens TaxID=105231 RepID=A0A1Y1I4Z1_KLENI|nr:hypothetical protein KFL_001620050 [Klebsormidium nitens]|eukprot:GAQ83787.1 hypothetical protein KFL_001620050 [Klebsormidium nitens]